MPIDYKENDQVIGTDGRVACIHKIHRDANGEPFEITLCGETNTAYAPSLFRKLRECARGNIGVILSELRNLPRYDVYEASDGDDHYDLMDSWCADGEYVKWAEVQKLIDKFGGGPDGQ